MGGELVLGRSSRWRVKSLKGQQECWWQERQGAGTWGSGECQERPGVAATGKVECDRQETLDSKPGAFWKERRKRV